MRFAIIAGSIIIADAIRPLESDWKMMVFAVVMMGLFLIWDLAGEENNS